MPEEFPIFIPDSELSPAQTAEVHARNATFVQNRPHELFIRGRGIGVFPARLCVAAMFDTHPSPGDGTYAITL